ncbi:MAG: hypothetical protein ISR62_03825 [Desulfobacteraceae bacterium]|nr:hypothetical protein [Desulfobacterales bacterium]MBL6967532.1 hypothetical protein [Desulfobacteraceae bacterium]
MEIRNEVAFKIDELSNGLNLAILKLSTLSNLLIECKNENMIFIKDFNGAGELLGDIVHEMRGIHKELSPLGEIQKDKA